MPISTYVLFDIIIATPLGWCPWTSYTLIIFRLLLDFSSSLDRCSFLDPRTKALVHLSEERRKAIHAEVLSVLEVIGLPSSYNFVCRPTLLMDYESTWVNNTEIHITLVKYQTSISW